jgi:hypothetical protein
MIHGEKKNVYFIVFFIDLNVVVVSLLLCRFRQVSSSLLWRFCHGVIVVVVVVVAAAVLANKVLVADRARTSNPTTSSYQHCNRDV